jgi:hypothetical protein
MRNARARNLYRDVNPKHPKYSQAGQADLRCFRAATPFPTGDGTTGIRLDLYDDNSNGSDD